MAGERTTPIPLDPPSSAARPSGPNGEALDSTIVYSDGSEHSEIIASAGGDVSRKILALSDANRANPSADVERELLRLRHERCLGMNGAAAPADVSAARAAPVPLDPAVGLAVSHSLPEAAVVRSTIQTHGSLVVRGLLNSTSVERLRSSVESALAARELALSGVDAPGASPWYSEFAPLGHQGSRAFTASSGVLAVDSPRGLFHLLEIFREAGVDQLARDFLGGPPILSAEKSVFRRVEPTPFASWHQDGAFLGERIRTLDVWIALSRCGKTAPSLEILPRRVSRVLPTGAFFSWDLDDKEIEKEFPGFTTVLAQFEPGDAILFDQLCVHRSGHVAGMTEPRLAIECWLFAPGNVPEGYTGLVL